MSDKVETHERGLSRQGLDKVREVLTRHVEHGAAPGVVAYLYHRGQEHVETIGMTEIGGQNPILRDAIFRISSMTKPVTAAAAMVLVDDGTVDLDEPVDRLLPELANRQVLRTLDAPLDDTVPANRPITVRDLLTFTMGFGIVLAAPDTYPIQTAMERLSLGQHEPQPSVFPPPDEWIRRLGSLPLMHQPGEQWMYNTGCDVLGVLIARAAGQPFDRFLRERLFAPLGMKDTGFSVPADALDRFAPEYWTDPATGTTGIFDPAEGGQWNQPPAFPSGAAGLVSTVDDFAAFGRMLLDRGERAGARILSRSSVALLTANTLTPRQRVSGELFLGDERGWGFGLSVFTNRAADGRSPGTYGWDGGLGTTWYADPAEDLTAVLMTHRMWDAPDGPQLFRDFWTEIYRSIA